MRRITLLAVPLLLAACEPAANLTSPSEPAFAKGGGKPPTVTNVSSTTTVHDVWQNGTVETDIRSDGGGAYVDGECGAGTWIVVSSDGSNGARLYPDITETNCRRATLRMLTRHDGINADGTHNDVAVPFGEFDIREIKMKLDVGLAVVNAPTRSDGAAGTSCFEMSRNGRIAGQGLRFDANNFPGSNSLVVETLQADRHYHVHTLPYPDNLAYCSNNDGVSYWHVVMDLEFEAS